VFNLVELLEEPKPSGCKFGNLVEGHAIYCHHEDGPRKCNQFRRGDPLEDCELFVKETNDD